MSRVGRQVSPACITKTATVKTLLYASQLSPLFLLKQRMMEVVSGDNWTTGATSRAKLQSNHHHQQTNIQFF